MPKFARQVSRLEIQRRVDVVVLSSKATWRQNSLFLGVPRASLDAWMIRNLPAMQEKIPGEGSSYPLQYSVLENSMHCVVHRVSKSQT